MGVIANQPLALSAAEEEAKQSQFCEGLRLPRRLCRLAMTTPQIKSDGVLGFVNVL